MGQVNSTLVQERERVGNGLRKNLTRITLQRCDTGRCGGIDAVIFATTAPREFPDPRSRGRRNIEDHLAERQQPQRQMVTEPISILDRPGPFGPCFRPNNQPPVFSQGRLDTQ